jgi:ABC-type spermidine/putrescine transport system permease subunit II
MPVAVLVVFAVNDSELIGLPFRGFTLRWFDAVLQNTILLDALWLSLRVAAIAVGISVVLGTLAAVQLVRARGTVRGLSLATISLPLFLPPVVLGLAIIIGLNFAGIERGMWTIVAGHTVITLPIVTLLVLVRLEGLDRNQELAAMDLGATPLRALLWVSVPQAVPGIVAATMIAFAISLDEFIMTFLITGSQTTLPLYVYGSLRFGISPELNAISALILALSFLLLTLGALIAVRRDRGNRVRAGRGLKVG